MILIYTYITLLPKYDSSQEKQKKQSWNRAWKLSPNKNTFRNSVLSISKLMKRYWPQSWYHHIFPFTMASVIWNHKLDTSISQYIHIYVPGVCFVAWPWIDFQLRLLVMQWTITLYRLTSAVYWVQTPTRHSQCRVIIYTLYLMHEFMDLIVSSQQPDHKKFRITNMDHFFCKISCFRCCQHVSYILV